MMRMASILLVLLGAAGCGSSSTTDATKEPPDATEERLSEVAPHNPVACSCRLDEVCVDDLCLTPQLLSVHVTLDDEWGHSVFTNIRKPGPVSHPAEELADGDCFVSDHDASQIGTGYVSADFDPGTVTMTVGDAAPMTIPDDDHLAFEGLIPPGAPLGVSWSGSADFPAGELVADAPAYLDFTDPDPIVPGQPWTLSWSKPADVVVVIGTKKLAICNVTAANGVTVSADTTALLGEHHEDSLAVHTWRYEVTELPSATGQYRTVADIDRYEAFVVPVP